MSSGLGYQSRTFSPNSLNHFLSANPREMQRWMGSLEPNHILLSYGSENSIIFHALETSKYRSLPGFSSLDSLQPPCKGKGLSKGHLPLPLSPALLASMSIAHFSQGLRKVVQGLIQHTSHYQVQLFIYTAVFPTWAGALSSLLY